MLFRLRTALVVELLAFAQAQLHLDAAVLEVQRQGNERHAVLHHAGVELEDLPLVHQQTPGPHRILIKNVPVLVGADVHAPYEKLPVLDGAEAVLQIDLPGADGLDLRPGQLNPGLVALQHKIVVKRFAVVGYVLDALLFRQASHFLS